MKRLISMLLTVSMFIAMMTPMWAEEDVSFDAAEMPEAITAESEIEGEYAENTVLFALDADVSLDEVSEAVKAIGVTVAEPVFTNENGDAVSIGKNEEVWYKGYTSEDIGAVITALCALDGVVFAEPEYIYTADNYGEPTEAEKKKDWVYEELSKKDGKYWWKEYFKHNDTLPGEGTVIAVIDTGVDYTHEDLASSMWVNVSELYGKTGVDDDGNGYIDDIHGIDVTATGVKAGNPMDDNGHGTHVAGILAMSSNGVGGVGLAYGSKIMAIKAGYSTGTFASVNIAKAINYAHMMGADVINMSFGGTAKSYLIESALENAFSDCVLVASAGNDGIPTTDAPSDLYPKRADIYPAGYSYVIGVMATDSNGKLASFSNWDYAINKNAEYEMTAPGTGIYSTLPGNRYGVWNGTSMAAPFVSAAAAIIRSHYSDNAMYSSRFIMGQLTSATNATTFYESKDEIYFYPALNIYDSIVNYPKPNITVKDSFLMDNVGDANGINDGDAIIEAGETVDLGVLIRNQWGQTGDITVRADAISVGGVANPYISFITDEITLQPAGTFAEVNNGWVYDDTFIVGVNNPIKFTVSPETPNDAQICINITVTTVNGSDASDKTIYTDDSEYTFRVQSGRGISGTIYEDTTLTNDYLWIIENAIYIPEGVTLTIEPGTKIQFWSTDFEDAYGTKSIVYIDNEGTFNAIGTEEAPIEMYPGAGFEQFAVNIFGTGVETLKYCNIINPMFYDKISGSNANEKFIDIIDHCMLVQNYKYIYYRYIASDGLIGNNYDIHFALVNKITNTKIYNCYWWHASHLNVNCIQNCLFDSCRLEIRPLGSDAVISQNNVFMSVSDLNTGVADYGYWKDYSKAISLNLIHSIQTYDGASSKYVSVSLKDYTTYSIYYDCLAAVARSLGGTLASINDAEEEAFILKYGDSWIGYRYDYSTGEYKWDDGSSYEIDVHEYNGKPYTRIAYLIVDGVGKKLFVEDWSIQKMILELPATLSDEQIKNGIKGFDYSGWLAEYVKTLDENSNNAIINPVLNNDPNTWARFEANAHNSSNYPNYAMNNYWGTENEMLINKMIVDADDHPGIYQDIVHQPILTLESESLSDIYPFVTKVYLTDSYGNIVSNVSPGEEYSVHVHFNRDMDTSVQPSVSYGPATPYTDYAVQGSFVSNREWVGTTKISPILTSGTMYFRTLGGVAADDNWLECGEDVLRFSFNVAETGALAMMLHANGGANKIELSWAQNDYDVLAGYNIYRSTQETGGFTKINTTILTGNEYTDTDVLPGVIYYYYFKVVNTDGNEEDGESNIASAAPIDNIFPTLKHTPVTAAKAGSQITVSATASDNIEVAAVTLYYRNPGDAQFTAQAMTVSSTSNLYVATIPAASVIAAGVEYYVTAADADGNVRYSGTAQLPHAIEVNSSAYISGITPSKISIEGGNTVTILGGNFSEGMILKVGSAVIEEYSLLGNGQITFIAPAMPSGSYAVSITTESGAIAASPTALSYTDSSSIAQIPTDITMTSGVPYVIPFYATSNSQIVSLHAELDLPYSDFTAVKAVKADENANFQLDYTYSGGILRVGCIGVSDINTSGEALFNIIVTPRVTEDKQYQLTLHDVSFNGVAVNTVISANAVLKASYVIDASVKYYADSSVPVSGVTITASGASAVTDETGSTSITVAQQLVTVSASRQVAAHAITAYDASLVLQSAIGKITLNEYQLIAADVDGNNAVNEYDAALILQMAVRKIDVFPSGAAWIFAPSSIDKTLSTTSVNMVSFVAISVGDVDGSYRGDGE